jgi:ssDNA-binding Zn-finger/Zn-ribbon topoisomerase 1
MTQSQGEIEPRRCPRCGGRMLKPAGSTLYWHANNNHPRCDITNIVDTSETAQAKVGSEPPIESEPPKGSRRKK